MLGLGCIAKFVRMTNLLSRSLSENSVVGPRASAFSPGKDGEAGDVGFIVDTAGCSQADNSGCLDPTVAAKQLINKTVQENKPLEARSSFPTEPTLPGSVLPAFCH